MKDQAYDLMFKYILNLSDGKASVTPKQLEKIIGISDKQQSVLRQEKKFPIPWKHFGKLVHYSIHDVISYLLNGESEEHKAKRVKEKNNNSDVESMSHLFKLRAFATNVKEEGEQLIDMSVMLDRIINTTESYDKLKAQIKH